MAILLASLNMSIQATPLTAEAFAPFGTIIKPPLPASTTTIPDTAPPNAVYANQNTALKYPSISPITSTYPLSPSGIPANPTTSLFSCFPRTLRTSHTNSIFDVRILERHPFTTQSFVPLFPPSSTSKTLIIVAPTLASPAPPSALTPYFPQYQWKQGGPPDLQNLKAFVAEQPGVGVTYGVGTWHAPMVVLGEGRVDFVVTQWVNGREGEDCQEVEVPEGLEVVVDLGKAEVKARAKL